MDNVTLYTGECATIMAQHISDGLVDLTVTSPPYDDLRSYQGFTFDFEAIAQQLWRVTKPGGVVVWVVGDATIDGSETGTSFRQALGFMELEFMLHDTMIYQKSGFRYPFPNRYHQVFEYMFVFSKGTPKTFNPIEDRKNLQPTKSGKNMKREQDGSKTYRQHFKATKYGKRFNVWRYNTGLHHVATDNLADRHPAIFPEDLARDHILSWSNPGDIVLDPMCGSGTTLKMAILTGRKAIGIDISSEYIELTRTRVQRAMLQMPLPLDGQQIASNAEVSQLVQGELL